MAIFDNYTLRARAMPAAEVCIPPFAFALSSLASVEDAAKAVGLVGTLATLLVSEFVRERGKKLEAGLWEEWGGIPTLVRMRWEGNPVDVIAKRHAAVTKVTDVELPTAEEEAADPTGADATYDDAVGVLLGLTRKTDEWPTVADELADYGRRRNSLGLRTLALCVAAVTFVLSVVLLVVLDTELKKRVVAYGIPAVVSVVCFAVWLVVVKRSWVRTPADRYADALFGAARALAVKK